MSINMIFNKNRVWLRVLVTFIFRNNFRLVLLGDLSKKFHRIIFWGFIHKIYIRLFILLRGSFRIVHMRVLRRIIIIDSNKELGSISLLLMLVSFLIRIEFVTKLYRMPNSRTIGVKYWKPFAHNGNIRHIPHAQP